MVDQRVTMLKAYLRQQLGARAAKAELAVVDATAVKKPPTIVLEDDQKLTPREPLRVFGKS